MINKGGGTQAVQVEAIDLSSI